MGTFNKFFNIVKNQNTDDDTDNKTVSSHNEDPVFEGHIKTQMPF